VISKQLAELTYAEAAALRARSPIVLVPVGAQEAHGPHLPLATDCFIAEELARRAADALGNAVVAPTIVYSRADFAAGFAGTVTLDAAAFESHLAAVLAALGRAGFQRQCLVNAHIEPAHVDSLRAACASSGAILADMTERTWRHRLKAEAQGIDGHAGAFETALVLAARPDLVRTPLPAESAANLGQAIRDGARTFEEAGGSQAYFGSPARATRELGERIYKVLVEMVTSVCAEKLPR
jgi:creatinine amidohydrolase